MEKKEIYYRALIRNNGQCNEIDLGYKLGLDQQETQQIITQLLSEYKIIYKEQGACSYRSVKVYKKV